ncbi:MAG: hypothetical protein AAF915_25600 [Cyanobacteria bacterium P01_D01_bin.50]
MKLDEKKVYLMANYEKFKKNNYTNKFQKPLQNNQNNVYFLKPEFRQYVNKKTTEDLPDLTVKSVFISVIVICLWCFSMCLLAKASYDILQQICIHSVQELNLDRK